MFYSVVFFLFCTCADRLFIIGDRYWRKLTAAFKKPNQQIHFCLCSNRVPFYDVGCLFSMGAYIYYPDYTV